MTLTGDQSNSTTGKTPIVLKQEKIPITTKSSKIPILEKSFKKPLGLKSNYEPVVSELRAIKFTGDLYDYQQTVLDWTKGTISGILGLDMGLGKTRTMGAKICLQKYRRTIIVLPLSILDQWRQELCTVTDITETELLTYWGTKRQTCDFEKARVVLTTYDVVKADINSEETILYLYRNGFDCIVLDEAHLIRNTSTKAFATCFKLGSSCKSKWLLTGTTIHNKYRDLVSLAEFLNMPEHTPTWFGTCSQDDLKAWRKKYYYTLKKDECNIKLPKKIIQDIYLEFDDNHKKIYGETHKEVMQLYSAYQAHPIQLNFTSLLAKITRLRQCCNHPNAMFYSKKTSEFEKPIHDNYKSSKFGEITNLIKNASPDDKFLIFSQWTQSLNMLNKWLSGSRIECLQYDGSLSAIQKNSVLADFKQSKTQVLLLNIQSGGVGLNLTCANNVIILDSWWTNALEEQAIDRVYRIGQKKQVNVYRLYMNNTIEHWMVKMKDEKKLVDKQLHNKNLRYEINREVLKQLLHAYV